MTVTDTIHRTKLFQLGSIVTLLILLLLVLPLITHSFFSFIFFSWLLALFIVTCTVLM